MLLISPAYSLILLGQNWRLNCAAIRDRAELEPNKSRYSASPLRKISKNEITSSIKYNIGAQLEQIVTSERIIAQQTGYQLGDVGVRDDAKEAF